MYITITCSNCGNHRRISDKRWKYIEKVIDEGWNSVGSAMYCPECVKTWQERNPSTMLAGANNTFYLIVKHIWKSECEGGN